MTSYFAALTTIEIIFLSLFFGLFIIQLLYILICYLQPLFLIKDENKGIIHYNNSEIGVSVIVYANNDSENLRNNLASILEQDYSNFEVIVVNDGSSDESEDVLSDFGNRYDNLYHTFLSEEARNLSRKKLSITLGIKAARHEIVLLTTANCVPASNQWIKNIAKNFTDKTDIVIGATKFCTDKGLISNFIDFDTLQRNFRVFSYSLLLRPFYAEGTNLAYRKSLFFKNKGFARFMHLHLGDDDLFINQYATKRNAKIELAKDSLIIANYDNKRSAWSHYKRNVAFTSKFYKSFSKLLFGFESLSKYLFWIVFILLLSLTPFNSINLIICGVIILLKLILQYVFWFSANKKLGYGGFVWLQPFYELIMPITDSYMKITSFFNKKKNYTWHI